MHAPQTLTRAALPASLRPRAPIHPLAPLRRRAVLRPLALAIALGLAGCSHVPLYQRPAAPVAERFPGTPADAATRAAEPVADQRRLDAHLDAVRTAPGFPWWR